MSKGIWHKPSETTDVDNNLIIDDWTNGTYELGYFDDNDMVFRNFRNNDIHDEESMMRWCDVDELIDDYNRTRKALDVLLLTINRLENQNYKDCAWNLRLAIAKIKAIGIADKALKQKDVK